MVWVSGQSQVSSGLESSSGLIHQTGQIERKHLSGARFTLRGGTFEHTRSQLTQ